METDIIYNLDCIKGMKYLPNETIDLIVTDPPYLISYKTNHRKDKSHEFCSVIKNDDNKKLIKDYIKECYRVLKDNTAMYIFCSWKTEDFFREKLTDSGFLIKNKIIWVKNNWSAGDLTGQFGQQYEIIFLVAKGKPKFNGKRITDVWNFDRVVGKKQFHQNQKPVELLELCIEKHSKENDIILDGFMGVGSTALACKKLNRHFIGFELERKYCSIAEERLKEYEKNK